jgi:RNA polymerase sigma-70 factor (ECF subfamily)
MRRMSRFDHTTQWSLVLRARGAGREARVALDTLCRTYRPPVLAFIRSRGHEGDAAEDLTQMFFANFLERASHAHADPLLGRFRSFLLTAVKRFLINSGEASRAQKRGGLAHFESFDDDACGSDDDAPERAFERAWAYVVLESALRRLRDEAEAAGKRGQFDRLRDFLVESPDESDYERVAAELGLRRNTLAVAVHRMRQRLRELVRDVVAETTAGRADLDDELRDLRTAFGVALAGVDGAPETVPCSARSAPAT